MKLLKRLRVNIRMKPIKLNEYSDMSITVTKDYEVVESNNRNDSGDSSINKVITLYRDELKPDFNELESSTYLNESNSQEKTYEIRSIIPDVTEKLKYLQKNYVNEFFTLLMKDNFEDGFTSNSEKYFKELLEYSKDQSLSIINEVFLKAIKENETRVISGILQIVAHCDYNRVYPVGQTLALAAINIPNNEIKENAIMVYDYWDDKDAIGILEGIKCDSEWLDSYRLEVIEDLKGSM